MKIKGNSFGSGKHSLIIVAAGKSERFGKVDKLLCELQGKPVIAYSLNTFVESRFFSEIILVYRDDQQRKELSKTLDLFSKNMPIRYVLGGNSRQASVTNGLAVVSPENHYVWIHDGARPFIHCESLTALKKAVEEHHAAVLAHRVTDTIQRGPLQNKEAVLLENIDRSTLWAMETPQCFKRALIVRAHNNPESANSTDDVSAVCALKHPVLIVENQHPNPKLTRPADKPYFEFLASRG